MIMHKACHLEMKAASYNPGSQSVLLTTFLYSLQHNTGQVDGTTLCWLFFLSVSLVGPIRMYMRAGTYIQLLPYP